MSNLDVNKAVFKEEANELLSELESSLLQLEESPDDMDLIGRVFRAMHTIKGSGAMFGFDDIAEFTHEVETVFDMVRNGALTVSKDLIDLTLAARDRIRNMLDASESGTVADEATKNDIVISLRKISQKPAAHAERADAALDLPGTNEEATYRIRFRPPKDIYLRGINPSSMLEELRQMGECKIVAQTHDIPVLDHFNTDYCYTYWDIILTTDKGLNALRDVFIFIEDDSELKIEAIYRKSEFETEKPYKKLGEILIERGDLKPSDLEKLPRLIGEKLIDAGLVQAEEVRSALAEQQHRKELQEKLQKTDINASIRVPSEKLDKLVNLVGELVTVQARLTQTASGRGDPVLLSIAEEVERLADELRDNTMNIRMLQIGTTFSKFKRLVRDLSKELGKEIHLSTEGAETELDKTVIEKLNDPLVHLIRNSIDHGIESPEIRKEAGKQERGTIHLSAMHSGAHVLIQIRDDGAGLDKDVIRAKAVEKGLISSDAELTEKEVFSLVLAPGFSTAKTVTSVSGRGVGMDVVKQAIDALHGTIDICSQKGIGTTITLKLPLTLAIIEGLLVRIGKDHFVLPLAVVKECVELVEEDSAEAHGRHIANVRGRIIPYIKLRERFGINGGVPDIEQVVIAEIGDNNIGFVVDAVIGEHQTVIKSLGTFYKNVEGVSGATILGDGTVAMILDVSKITMLAEAEEKNMLRLHRPKLQKEDKHEMV
ncbi:MAG: chemotaxis protein CheA [Dissulfurispiraceae bacterium]